MVAHRLAAELGLEHVSTGEGKQRFVTLYKEGAAPPTGYSAQGYGQAPGRQPYGHTPEDLQKYMAPAVKRRDNSIRHYVDLIAEFDLNKDGALDREEFAAMIRGQSGPEEATQIVSTIFCSQPPSSHRERTR